MGVGQSAALALVGTAGVGANKLATSISGLISEANDAKKSKMMAQKAKQNKEQAINNRKEQLAGTKNTLKKVEAANQGMNKDIKTNILAKELMRDR